MTVKRDYFGIVFLVAVIAAAAGFAAITRFPDARWVQVATRAVVIGPWIEKLAAMYRRPDRTADAGELEVEGGPEIIYEIDLERHEARPRIIVRRGKTLFTQPSEESPLVATVASTANLLLFDRDGDWYRVRYGDREGWVVLPLEAGPGEPPLGSEPDPPKPVPARPPDREVLAAARKLLDRPVDPVSLGPYPLYTDVRDAELLAFLSALAQDLESVYSNRFGLPPLPGTAEVVVLYSSRENYERFQRFESKARFLTAPAIVRSGVVATYTGRRAREEIASSLLHELTHLINRRAVGPALPPWLDEGLADDLAQSRIRDGRLMPGLLGGSFRQVGNRTEYRGGRAAAVELKRAMDRGDLPSLEALLGFDWDQFQGAGPRSLRYGQSSFFVRSLLDSPDPDLARDFRAFLRDVANGRPLTAEALQTRLGRPWSQLDKRLQSFVRLQVVEAGVPTDSDSSSRQQAEPSS